MKTDIYEPREFYSEYQLHISDDDYYTEGVELDEDEIIELAGITAQLAAKIAQRRADEKANATVTRCEGVIRGVDTNAYSVGETFIYKESEGG